MLTKVGAEKEKILFEGQSSIIFTFSFTKHQSLTFLRSFIARYNIWTNIELWRAKHKTPFDISIKF